MSRINVNVDPINDNDFIGARRDVTAQPGKSAWVGREAVPGVTTETPMTVPDAAPSVQEAQLSLTQPTFQNLPGQVSTLFDMQPLGALPNQQFPGGQQQLLQGTQEPFVTSKQQFVGGQDQLLGGIRPNDNQYRGADTGTFLQQGQQQGYIEGRKPLRGYRWSRNDIEQWDLQHRQKVLQDSKRLNVTEGMYVSKMMPLTSAGESNYEQWWEAKNKSRFIRKQHGNQEFVQDLLPAEVPKPDIIVQKAKQMTSSAPIIPQARGIVSNVPEKLAQAKEKVIHQAHETARIAQSKAPTITRGWELEREGAKENLPSLSSMSASAATTVKPMVQKIRAKLPSPQQLKQALPNEQQWKKAGKQVKIAGLVAGRLAVRAGTYAKNVMAPKVVQKSKEARTYAQDVVAPTVVQTSTVAYQKTAATTQKFVPKTRAAAAGAASKAKLMAMQGAEVPLSLAVKSPLVPNVVKAGLSSMIQEKDLVTFADTYHKSGVQGTVNYVDTFRSDYLGLDLYRPLGPKLLVGQARQFFSEAYSTPLTKGAQIVRSPAFQRFQNVALIILGAIIVQNAFKKRAIAMALATTVASNVSGAATTAAASIPSASAIVAAVPSASTMATTVTDALPSVSTVTAAVPSASTIASHLPSAAAMKSMMSPVNLAAAAETFVHTTAKPFSKMGFQKKRSGFMYRTGRGMWNSFLRSNPSLYGLSLIGNAFRRMLMNSMAIKS